MDVWIEIFSLSLHSLGLDFQPMLCLSICGTAPFQDSNGQGMSTATCSFVLSGSSKLSLVELDFHSHITDPHRST